MDINEIVIYDIVAASRTVEEHILIVGRIFQRLAKYGLKLKTQKYKVACSEIEYLGYKISKTGTEPLDRHIQAIKNYLQPKNLCEFVWAFVHILGNLFGDFPK